jgi:hypothetical protein
MIVAAVEAEQAVNETKINERRARDAERKRRSRAASAMSRGQPVTPSPSLSPSTPPSITTPPVGGDGRAGARDGVVSTQAIELADEVMAILGVDREFVPPRMVWGGDVAVGWYRRWLAAAACPPSRPESGSWPQTRRPAKFVPLP